MPKISEHAGPTDESQPGYYDKGESFQSPEVITTEEDARYEDAMSRHGTDEFSDEDQRVVTEYQEKRRANAEAEIAFADQRGEERDYLDLTYAQLQDEAKRRNLSSTGTADAIRARLREDDAKNA